MEGSLFQVTWPVRDKMRPSEARARDGVAQAREGQSGHRAERRSGDEAGV